MMKDYEYDSLNNQPLLWEQSSVWHNDKQCVGFKHINEDMQISALEWLEIYNSRKWKALIEYREGVRMDTIYRADRS